MKLFLISSLTFLCFYASAHTDVLEHTIESQIFEGERAISVMLPENYTSDSTTNFVVAYVFDGQFEPYVKMVHSMMNFYAQSGMGIPMIIVGVHTQNRWGEFVTMSEEDIEVTGLKGASQLTDFLSKELIPWVEENYRVEKLRVGFGHSLWGTYVLNELMKENSIFDAVIAASSNLTMNKEKPVNDAVDFIRNHADQSKFAYTTCGTEGDMENDFK